MDNKPESLQNPNQSADKKYYASGQRSVINGGTTTNVRTPSRVDPKKTIQSDMPMSADVYYKDPGEQRQRGSVMPVVVPGAGGRAVDMPVTQAGVQGTLRVLRREDIRPCVAAAIGRARDGAPTLVEVADQAWLAMARTLVELAVGREDITHDQGRDIVFGVRPAAQPAAPKHDVVELEQAPEASLPAKAADKEIAKFITPAGYSGDDDTDDV
jgi:hypothetical protein